MTCGPITGATLPRPGPCIGRAPLHAIAGFTHSIKTRVNAVKFAHQSLCNPKISTMLKAVRKGFLDGCPNINVKLILKYLTTSPATAKGHMKWPRHGIKSTTPRETATTPNTHIPNVTAHPIKPVDSISHNSEQTSVIVSEQSLSEYNTQRPHLVVDDSGETIANVSNGFIPIHVTGRMFFHTFPLRIK